MLSKPESRSRGAFLLDDHIDRADITFNPATKTGTFTRVEVSIGRMLAETCAACAATGLAVCLLILRQYSAAASEKHQVQELVEEREAS
ncbi:MAG: hypothetical protein JWM16_4608 [Verrucomicrobiales bacterium]|nr:hypothetical protein [Verrucomicrobiales bacterium]